MNRFKEFLDLVDVTHHGIVIVNGNLNFSVTHKELIPLSFLTEIQRITGGTVSISYEAGYDYSSLDVLSEGCDEQFLSDYQHYKENRERLEMEQRRAEKAKQRELNEQNRAAALEEKNRQKLFKIHGGEKRHQKFLIEQELERRAKNGIKPGSFIDSPDNINPWMP